MDHEALKAAGWALLDSAGFTGLTGPFWARDRGPECSVGFVAGPQHANGNPGSVHGGMLMTFADNCLGYAVVQSLGGTHCVTAQLQVHFVSGARVGDFITCRPEIVRRSAQLVFMRGLLCVGERTVASADGIWKILEPKPRP